MIVQTLVQSGFDAEVLLGSRYLQYLLLLAVDAGVIPTTLTFGDPPATLTLHVPDDLDRTYVAGDPQGEPFNSNAGPLSVEVLIGHPTGADLRIKVLLHVVRASDGIDIPGIDIGLFVKLQLDTTHDAGGTVLESAAMSLELVDVDGTLVNFAVSNGATKDEILEGLRGELDRTLDLTSAGSGSRLQDIALRKLAATESASAALGIYLNLRLKSGPHPDNFVGPRGDVTLARNFLDSENDLVFGMGPAMFGLMATDAFHRRAKPDGSGFSYPITSKGERVGKIHEISFRPVVEEGQSGQPDVPLNKLRIQVDAEYSVDTPIVDIIEDPNFKLLIDLSLGIDADGLLTWNADSVVRTGLLADLILGALAAITIPFIGPYAVVVFAGLELGKHIAEELLSDAFVEDRVEKKLDAALLDIAPNRFTILRRRWDPFFTTHHQIGLRPGGLLVNEHGLALFGKAALSRAPEALTDVGIVIRRAEPDPDQAPTDLVFRVADAEAFAAEFTTPAAGADRGSVVKPDPVAEPLLFSLPRAEAVERVASKRLVGDVGYEVKRIDVDDNQITHLLVISQSEIAEVRGPLLNAHITAITEQVAADNEATIRQEVIDEFAAQGIIAPQEQIDATVAARLQALIDAAVQDIEENVLPGELEAALLPLLSFDSQPTFFGEMQTEHLLAIKGFDLIKLTATERFYYRDHFDSATEKTLAEKRADNLRSKPRYQSTPTGPVLG